LASRPEAAARTPAHNFGLDTVADYPARDDDRELQTEQPIVGLLARKLQLDRMNARSRRHGGAPYGGTEAVSAGA
jgi:hypothetical protein